MSFVCETYRCDCCEKQFTRDNRKGHGLKTFVLQQIITNQIVFSDDPKPVHLEFQLCKECSFSDYFNK